MNRIIYTTPDSVPEIMQRSWAAFSVYKKTSPHKRAALLNAIAHSIENISKELVESAQAETNLDASRLRAELNRTKYQLQSYGEACADGTALEIRIDTPTTDFPARPDLRKMQVPLGPVVVFGASNFPFAYSTAGGDTACALAAGCPVIVKAHPGHAQTSGLVATAISRAIENEDLPADIFIHIYSESFDTAHALVQHPLTRAVGFTGSFEGGKALYDLACNRPDPIPVFAEMGSVNPVFILPGKLKSAPADIAGLLASSITLSAGQFCTNPGILVAINNEGLTHWEQTLESCLDRITPHKMLHEGIERNFREKLARVMEQEGVSGRRGFLATVPAQKFLENPVLQKEVFGPFSLLVKCDSLIEMIEVAKSLEGQLTASIFAEQDEMIPELVDVLQLKCGRFIMNGVPTGVEVTTAMHHGGPFPATTDSRFTAVGSDGIRRFSRPVCYQNWNDELLPAELKNSNPFQLCRKVNGINTRSHIVER